MIFLCFCAAYGKTFKTMWKFNVESPFSFLTHSLHFHAHRKRAHTHTHIVLCSCFLCFHCCSDTTSRILRLCLFSCALQSMADLVYCGDICVRRHCTTITASRIAGVFLICWVPFFSCNMLDAMCTIFGAQCSPGVTAFILTTWLGYMNR